MRVRVNFTIDLDPEEYREAFGTDADKRQIRRAIQHLAIADTLTRLQGLKVRFIASNNTYA